MNSEQFQRVDHLLQAALELPPAERGAFLARECAGDAELELEVQSLLASHREAGSFLGSSALEMAARALAIEDDRDPPEASPSLKGQTISHYHVVEELGAGGMGVVWKARDTRLDRFVALKVLPGERMGDAERKRRFAQEARAASGLNHPNIITIYDIDQSDGVDFIAMEFVQGKTLDRLIPRKGMRLSEALRYAIQVADALAAAHVAGIVHRDLKPANVMVTGSGCVKVLDFGLAKLTEPAGSGEFARSLAAASRTDEGTIVGTVQYMSPEQAEGKRVDARADIFSFGAMLYEMVTGRQAFSGDSMISMLSAILRDEPAPPGEIVQGLPRDLDQVVTRCLRKDPARRYQHAGDLKLDLQQVQEEAAAGEFPIHEEPPKRRSGSRRWWSAAVVAISLMAGWWLRTPPAAPVQWKVTRLTAEDGLADWAVLSPDGKMVAYSSDRSGGDSEELYIKQVAGGQSIRLTSEGGVNTMPDFSPDGTKIVFWSNRDGSGIYEIAAFGGEPRLLARHGLNPKFSPDGSQVAYWVGAPSVAASVPGSGAVWVVPVSGGHPQQVGANFTAARYPIWTSDGKHLLMVGYTSAKAFDRANIDWWLVPVNGGVAIRTGAYQALLDARLQARDSNSISESNTPVPSMPRPGCWLAADDAVIFSTSVGDTQNLWELGVTPRSGKVSGIQRLTTGSGNEINPSCGSGGAVALTNIETRREIWSRPFDLNRGIPTGALEAITEGPAFRENPSFSTDGRHVAFVSDQSGRMNLWMRDLVTGKELGVAPSSLVQRYPVSNASGTEIAYSVYEKDQRLVYVSTPGGTPEKLCEGCLRATDWSRDEKALLVFGGAPYQIDVLDLASRQRSPLLKHATYNLLYGRFSPDNRWVSFTARMESNRGRIAIAPVDGPRPVPESDWITVAEAWSDDFGTWSPDGRTLYFSSRIDGNNCLWAQRLDAGSHRPVGEAFAVQHLHGRESFGHGGWSAAGGRIGIALAETTGNIWMMSRPGAR